MDMIGPIEPAASNGHHCILIAIDYFTKWVEVSTNNSVTKKVVAYFVRKNIAYRFGIPESIITYNAANLNSDLMREICEKFIIVHRNSTGYKPQMNGVAKVANKNIKRNIRKIVDNDRQWHEKLSFTLLDNRSTMRTSTRDVQTPYKRNHTSQEDLDSWILLDDYDKRQYLLRAEVSPVPDSRGFHLVSAE
uniref:Integrase catalytic domain-containing protein n=1 Tax=Nicotiana tabacum TaxID=4097 RepID=A0A1S4CN30_TOBAC|nr:PREDICTED: uncharacterized protein LOC107820824 [Nicotiana tabacum]